jgi:hypothetical protein
MFKASEKDVFRLFMEKKTEELTSRKRYARGLSLVTIVNIFSFVVGVVASLLIPYVLSINDFAVYKTYNLYTSYVGFFHFGFVDGIYLLFGGLAYDQIDKPKFRTFFWFFFVMEAVVGILATVLSFIFIHDQTMLIVMVLVIATMLATNITNYYGIIAQLTTDFKNYSFKNILRVVIKGLALVLLFVFWKLNILTNYLAYVYIVVGLILADILVDLDYMRTFKATTFGKCAPPQNLLAGDRENLSRRLPSFARQYLSERDLFFEHPDRPNRLFGCQRGLCLLLFRRFGFGDRHHHH